MDNTDFDFSKWQDQMDVTSNPVETKIRRDWLSVVLMDNLDGYVSKEDVDDWEFLAHYADRLFVECLKLSQHNPICITVGGKLRVKEKSGWCIEKNQFANMFNDGGNIFSQNFSQWLSTQENNGLTIMDELMTVNCNQGEESLNSYTIASLKHPSAATNEPLQSNDI